MSHQRRIETWRTTVWTARTMRAADMPPRWPANVSAWEVVNEKGELVADSLVEENARVVAQTPALLRTLAEIGKLEAHHRLVADEADIRAASGAGLPLLNAAHAKRDRLFSQRLADILGLE